MRRGGQDETVALSILQRIAAGDPQAVDECLDQYGGLIWSLAPRLSPVYADAEEHGSRDSPGNLALCRTL